jgi:hypothetical protein
MSSKKKPFNYDKSKKSITKQNSYEGKMNILWGLIVSEQIHTAKQFKSLMKVVRTPNVINEDSELTLG